MELLFIVVIGTAIWVYFDAKTIGVQPGQIKGLANMGPLSWALATFGIWIIAFPLYIAKRGEFKRINNKA